jgi:hypothetical protein
MRNPPYLVYEDIPRVDLWLKLMLASILALTMVLGMWLLFEDIVAAIAMFGITLFDALLFRAIMPRRYQIYSDRIRIVLGGPFALNIPFHDIAEARPASGGKAFAYWGLRFATSTHGVVEIIRRKGLDVVISPGDRDAFLERLRHSIDTVQ